jgi:hypothetical protein
LLVESDCEAALALELLAESDCEATLPLELLVESACEAPLDLDVPSPCGIIVFPDASEEDFPP